MEDQVPPLESGIQDRGSGMAGMCRILVTQGSRYIGIALLTALPVSTGKARTLASSVLVFEDVKKSLTFCLHRLHNSSTVRMRASRRSAFSVSSLVIQETPTYSHAHCDHKPNCWANDFTMAGVLVACTGQHMFET